MNIIFTCGGTGGHINPAIAVAKLLLERRPGTQILFVGAEEGMEKILVPREGFRLETLRISNYQRKWTPKGIWHNVRTAWNLCGAYRKADRLMEAFHPDVIVGTGGYASYPALREGARKGIPTLVHESNAVPGLTTRMAARSAERVMVAFEESRAYYDCPERVVVTGMPVREEFLYLRKSEARQKLGLDSRPLVISCWGSLGAREMNKKIVQFIRRETQDGDPFQHVHATGSYGWRWMPQYIRDQGVDLAAHPSVDMREYIYDMPLLMTAADLIICRGGASTISELTAAGTPAIIVPSPNVTDNHQEKNARILESHGGVLVLRESECDGIRLYETARELLNDPVRCAQMSRRLKELAVVDSAERILGEILKLANTRS